MARGRWGFATNRIAYIYHPPPPICLNSDHPALTIFCVYAWLRVNDRDLWWGKHTHAEPVVEITSKSNCSHCTLLALSKAYCVECQEWDRTRYRPKMRMRSNYRWRRRPVRLALVCRYCSVFCCSRRNRSVFHTASGWRCDEIIRMNKYFCLRGV